MKKNINKKSEKLSLKEAQILALSSQKLIGPILNPLEIIEHLGYIQIDTISVIERAHHHVFWSRNQKYKPENIDDLVKSRKAFEYWSHAASYLPMNEYRFSLPVKKDFQARECSWFSRDKKLMSAVLKRIRNEGALRSKDFENTKRGKTGWWDWKPVKKALEILFLEGSLEITRREGFQKVYDLPERVIPSTVNTVMPNESEYVQFLIYRTLRHHGLATINEIAYLKKKNIKTKISDEISKMIENKKIIQIEVEKNKDKYFAIPNALNEMPKSNSRIFILSPFDNLVIQRKKLKNLFDFDYQLECYVPSKKRKYGYFCLPVFDLNKGMARIDCKVDRKEKKLFINSIHYEKNVDKDLLLKKLKPKLKEFAKFNGCSSYHLCRKNSIKDEAYELREFPR